MWFLRNIDANLELIQFLDPILELSSYQNSDITNKKTVFNQMV